MPAGAVLVAKGLKLQLGGEIAAYNMLGTSLFTPSNAIFLRDLASLPECGWVWGA